MVIMTFQQKKFVVQFAYYILQLWTQKVSAYKGGSPRVYLLTIFKNNFLFSRKKTFFNINSSFRTVFDNVLE